VSPAFGGMQETTQQGTTNCLAETTMACPAVMEQVKSFVSRGEHGGVGCSMFSLFHYIDAGMKTRCHRSPPWEAGVLDDGGWRRIIKPSAPPKNKLRCDGLLCPRGVRNALIARGATD
jgi:hypothetical protein